jgi:hypothetical protein
MRKCAAFEKKYFTPFATDFKGTLSRKQFVRLSLYTIVLVQSKVRRHTGIFFLNCSSKAWNISFHLLKSSIWFVGFRNFSISNLYARPSCSMCPMSAKLMSAHYPSVLQLIGEDLQAKRQHSPTFASVFQFYAYWGVRFTNPRTTYRKNLHASSGCNIEIYTVYSKT